MASWSVPPDVMYETPGMMISGIMHLVVLEYVLARRVFVLPLRVHVLHVELYSLMHVGACSPT